MTVAANDIGFHFLYPSNVFVSGEPHSIQTILGSCVAVCLYDTKLKIGGMNHFMMPFWNGEGLASPKYGNISIEVLLENMLEAGAHQKDCVAKVFGGAHQFNVNNSSLMVGDRNIDVSETMLKKYKIPIVAHSMGGTQGRKILFNTFTGIVMMKFIVKPVKNSGKQNDVNPNRSK